ncbi:hypothetical protein glysoja_043374 [Glycine soja]|uniref:Uncharacterized protein n=1 Tax=Glycine soja TaxID=3848 RepID=A0A0B2SFM5_GLYSO|nr:hypothetical protein glysoja_043374 [Glycine soja]
MDSYRGQEIDWESEMELLLKPRNFGDLPLVQWPLFILASK